jgi:hypothetical protein
MMMNVKTVLAAAIVGLAIVTKVQASIDVYNWVPDDTKSTWSSPIGKNAVDSSGTLTFDSTANGGFGAITSFSFTYGSLSTDTIYIADLFIGNFLLHDGDLVLNGLSSDGNSNLITWVSTIFGKPDENSANPIIPALGTPVIFGDWVKDTSGSGSVVTPVPEPATVVAGTLMLLPFGMCVIRALRRNRAM